METAKKRAEQRAADNILTDPTTVADLADWIRGHADLLRDFHDDISDAVPPREVADDHNGFVEALSNLVGHTEDLLDRVDKAKSEAELAFLGEEWVNNPTGNELEDHARIACNKVQQAADDHGIQVDLCYEPRIP